MAQPPPQPYWPPERPLVWQSPGLLVGVVVAVGGGDSDAVAVALAVGVLVGANVGVSVGVGSVVRVTVALGERVTVDVGVGAAFPPLPPQLIRSSNTGSAWICDAPVGRRTILF